MASPVSKTRGETIVACLVSCLLLRSADSNARLLYALVTISLSHDGAQSDPEIERWVDPSMDDGDSNAIFVAPEVVLSGELMHAHRL